MTDMHQIHEFAVKWIDKFRDRKINYIELVDHYLADDCTALGFEMDCGRAFERAYGSAVYNREELDKIIDDITDISLLGSAIYSRWRYFNHWAYDGAEILKSENRAWFILALGRLAFLTGENTFTFEGIPKKMHIVSNNMCYGSHPEPKDEVEQHLTIDMDGQVCFSAYVFGDGSGEYMEARSSNFCIDKSVAAELLNKVSFCFSEEYIETFAADIGDWVLELTNTGGKTYKFRGSLCAEFETDVADLSDLIRNTLGLTDLYVFDGNNKPDTINRIVLDYHRLTKIKPREAPEGAEWEFVTWDYTEQLIIDRETETLEYIQNIGTGCKVSRRYEIEDGIDGLLDVFETDVLFGKIVGNPDDVVETPNEIKDYRITIDYEKNPRKVITGTFDKNGLPDDFPEFADAVFDFISFYGWGEILNPSVYGKAKRRTTDYIFCSVIFDEGQRSYYYLTEDDSIRINDFVVVPAGRDNHETVVKVVDIEYFPEGNTPFPVEKTKHIIRKCVDEDFDRMNRYD